MSKKEKIFWMIVAGIAGVAIGMMIISSMVPPARKVVNCNDGKSEQLESGVRKKTYIPAHDTCKEGK